LDRALGGTPTAIELVGEAGIGKTTLMTTLGAMARAEGVEVLTGRASEFEHDLPFGAISDALGSLAPALSVAPEGALRHLLYREVRSVLGSLAADRPVALLLDDLHWADPASIELVGSLLDRLPDAPILVAIAYRERSAPGALDPALRRARVAGILRRVEVGPLTWQAAAGVIGAGRSREEIIALNRECGGNPFYLEQLAHASTDDRRGAADGGTTRRLPAAVDASLATELAPLSELARTVLDAAAVVGDPFELSLAAEVAGTDEAASIAALDELVAADVVRPTALPRTFMFRHPLVRRAVYDRLPAGQRLQAHARAATLLREADAGAMALAHHVARSAKPGDAAAITELTNAGRQIAARAPGSAAEWFEAAWRLVPEQQRDSPDALALLHGLSIALLVSGRGPHAIELVEETLASSPAGHPRRPLVQIGCASLEALIGRHHAARTRLLAELPQLDPTNHFERLAVFVALARIASAIGDVPEVRIRLAETAELSQQLGPLGDVLAAPWVAWIAFLDGNLSQAREACDAARDAVDAMPNDAASAPFVEQVTALVRAEWALDRYSDAQRHLARAMVAARRRSLPILTVQLLAVDGMTSTARGDLRRAAEATATATEEAALLDNAEATMFSQLARAIALEPTSAVDDAVDAGRAAVTAAERFGAPAGVATAGQVFATALLAANLPYQAAEAIEATHGGDGLPDIPAAMRATSYALLARADLQRRDTQSAKARVRAARASHPDDGLAANEAMVCWAEAALAASEGDHRAAHHRVQLGARAAHSAGAVLLAARLELEAARALATLGDRDAATALFRAVEAQLASFGADRLQREAAAGLSALGRGITRSGRGAATIELSPDLLTERQREIADLVAAGLTNRQISERLYITSKTVETHLTAVFTKLSVASRHELADVMRSPRLAPRCPPG
jgi:DNA-binding NarL/FixJ family response regulator